MWVDMEIGVKKGIRMNNKLNKTTKRVHYFFWVPHQKSMRLHFPGEFLQKTVGDFPDSVGESRSNDSSRTSRGIFTWTFSEGRDGNGYD